MVQVLGKHVFTVLICISMSVLSGCFDLGNPVDENGNNRSGSGFADPPPSTPTENTAPRISGTPSSLAVIGSNWSFTPSATDSEGDRVTFEIENKPIWAAFNDVTGQLSGMPQLGHEGSYTNIRISATDGQLKAALPDFTVNVQSATTNAAPQISGNPPRTATVGQTYMFVAQASDADGDKLTFDIANRPRWANFNTTNGTLMGTPLQGDSALYENIVISVTDGQMMASLPAFSIDVSQVATSSVTLNWTPPTENEDGTPLTDLMAYKIYYGVTEGSYPNEIWIDNPGLTSYVVDNLAPNTYFFVSTSINSGGMESDFSNVATKVVN